MATIADLPAIIARLDSTDRVRFDRLFRVWAISGTCTCPDNMREWATRQFGSPDKIELQTVIRVQNLWTNEGALFNPLRSSRPTSRSHQDVLDAVQPSDERRAQCPLCRADEMTPLDPFGRIQGAHCVTASNAAKYDGKHGLLVFSEHDPLQFSREAMLDYFRVAREWFRKAADPLRGFKYPFLMWNCRWRAGASLEHGHMQMTMAKDLPYPKLAGLRLAATRYNDEHRADYFADLYGVHAQLGLGLQHEGMRLIASLCPFRDRETLVLAESLNDDLAAVVYEVLDAFRARAGVQAFNVGVLLPPIDRGVEWQGFPVIVRIIDRLSVAELPSDISGMGIFAGADAIAADPYGVIDLLAHLATTGTETGKPQLRKLFAAVDETEHVYTWDYSKQESASQLFDAGPDGFALITTCHEVDEETGAMLDLRIRDFTRCRLYSKRTLQVTETFDMAPESTLRELENRPWGSQLRRAEYVQLTTGRAFVSEGHLLFEEGSSTAEHAS